MSRRILFGVCLLVVATAGCKDEPVIIEDEDTHPPVVVKKGEGGDDIELDDAALARRTYVWSREVNGAWVPFSPSGHVFDNAGKCLANPLKILDPVLVGLGVHSVELDKQGPASLIFVGDGNGIRLHVRFDEDEVTYDITGKNDRCELKVGSAHSGTIPVEFSQFHLIQDETGNPRPGATLKFKTCKKDKFCR